MIKIMFLCTGNTCRSQMAEGFAKSLGKDVLFPFSAGSLPAGIVHPNAILVMNELGIDISGQKSKDIDNDIVNFMNMVITLCGSGEASCPTTPPHIARIHWAVDDPVRARGTEEEIVGAFRKARDEIMTNMLELINSLKAKR
ncbi:MAG: arsenate reductase ArsC [Nitrospirota bacterium]